MSAFWSWFIAILVIINIAGCVWLLWYTARRRPGDPAETDTSHYWDGDITEYNKPLPRWWINLFYITIVFSIGYLVWYPGFGRFEGVSGWTSAGEHDAARAEAHGRMEAALSRYDDVPLEELARDPQALAHGRAVFANNCATCHGSDARGARGFPNLADGNWSWGGEPEQVLASVLHGRHGVMPALGSALGSDRAITETAVFVQSLSGRRVDPGLAAAGEQRYLALCAACHGNDGRGNVALGAPDLTDNVWLYGGDFDSIRTSIVAGRDGQMPAHEPLIGYRRSKLAAAWVFSLNQPQDAVQAAPQSGGGNAGAP
jgi:cytochrome c oxidase cbb3-type subunit III